jgi:hypothetical protein
MTYDVIARKRFSCSSCKPPSIDRQDRAVDVFRGRRRKKDGGPGDVGGVAPAPVESADKAVLNELAEANRLYQDKFGFIFIVCATGKTAGEMLAICRARLGNSVDTELRLAAVEQSKITEIRLTKLLER